MAKKHLPKNFLNEIFADFANIFGKKYEFYMAENLALLDAALQKAASSLQRQIDERELNKGAIAVFCAGVRFPPGMPGSAAVEKLAGYARLHDNCRAADIRLDITFSDPSRLQDVYGADLGGRDCANGYIIADTNYPYSKSTLETGPLPGGKSSGPGL